MKSGSFLASFTVIVLGKKNVWIKTQCMSQKSNLESYKCVEATSRSLACEYNFFIHFSDSIDTTE